MSAQGGRLAAMNVLVFDIETVPDVDGGRRLYELPEDLSAADVARCMAHLRREECGQEFLRHPLHRVVAIAVAYRGGDGFKLTALGEAASTEPELIERFFQGVERYKPTLVSWNGGGFDLPVLHYRALLHGIAAPRYWESGDGDHEFRHNNYLNRFHARHTDLMDVLAAYQSRAYAPLDLIARLLHLPGKQGDSGAAVWDQFQRGEIAQIRDYCERDVLNTYLIYLRFELMRGRLTRARYAEECALLRDTLGRDAARWHNFLAAWPD